MTNQYIISIPKRNISFLAEEGTSLKEALSKHGIELPSACGGHGFCIKCLVKVNGENVLSCQTLIDKDMVVEIPSDESNYDGSIIENLKESNFQEDKIVIEKISDVGKVNSYSGGKVCVALDIGTTTIHIAAVDIQSNFDKKLPKNNGIFDESKTNEIFAPKEFEISSDSFYKELDGNTIEGSINSAIERAKIIGNEAQKGDFFSSVVDLFSNYPILYNSKTLNPQASLGQDTMSRISYCLKNGVSKAQNLVIAAINHSLKKFLAKYSLYEIEHVVVSGNVAMISMLLGGDVKSLSQFPYTSNYLAVSPKSSLETGIIVTNPIRKRAKVYYDLAPNTPSDKRRDNIDYNKKKIINFMPAVAPFVGGDFVSGLTLIKEPEQGKFSILIDMGTNTEMGIISRDRIVTTSSPAGPCFEGASISCGMSATKGAIYKFEFSEKNNTPVCQVLGSDLPTGICGSGLIDIIAELRSIGLLDKKGTLTNGQTEYKIGSISITQADIREYQLAKAAILTGIDLLMKEVGATEEDIDTIYLSGGFSDALSIKSVINSNLIPQNLGKKCVTIGNSSLYGAINSFRIGLSKAKSIVKFAEYIDMASKDLFQTTFLSKIDFE